MDNFKIITLDSLHMLASNICEGMQDETIALTIPTTMKAQLGLDARPLTRWPLAVVKLRRR